MAVETSPPSRSCMATIGRQKEESVVWGGACVFRSFTTVRMVRVAGNPLTARCETLTTLDRFGLVTCEPMLRMLQVDSCPKPWSFPTTTSCNAGVRTGHAGFPHPALGQDICRDQIKNDRRTATAIQQSSVQVLWAARHSERRIYRR
jgi:hypothetical protein